ncbi:hypothetical protein NHH03_24375 [Stieleria sp. TO1_6]|nr:hypothetical protein [Stieleria tagensis]
MTSPLVTCVLLVSPVVADPPSPAREQEEATTNYEDDAWYDVSEWFDGNDYNPTDEAIGRWDDEKFSYHDKQTSSDQDNDIETMDSDQFYGENYDDGYASFTDQDRDGIYESYTRYYDADHDSLYDTRATYRDTDRDGGYDDYQFSELSGKTKHDVPPAQIAQSTQKGLSGKAQKVSGKITDSKYVNRLGGIALMLEVNGSGDAESSAPVWVDMGNGASYQLFKGDSLTAIGPMTKAGKKQVLVATTVEIDGRQLNVPRSGRKYSGTIESIRTATVGKEKRTVTKLVTENGKKLTVDMGVAERAAKFGEGDEVSVTGIPVKLGDRVILVADTTSL